MIGSGDLQVVADLGVVHPNAARDRRAGIATVRLLVANPSAPTAAEEAVLGEMLPALGLKRPKAPAPGRRGLRVTWLPGTYGWRFLPAGKYLHAVLADGSRRAAACSAEPAEGWGWREPTVHQQANAPRCAACRRYLAPGGGARVV